MKYICNDIFMIRNTSLPIEIFFDLQKEDRIDEILDFIEEKKLLNFMKNSLIVSSKSLFYSIKKLGRSHKKDHAIYMSLFKYLIRATTRPTPFGILSSVMLGQFDTNNLNNYMFRIRNETKTDVKVDMYWLCGVIHNLENNYDILSKLKLKWNNICYVSGKRLKNPYYTNHGIDFTIEKIDIKFNPLIELIMHEADNYISFTELKDRISCEYSQVPEKIIIDTLKLLIDNEILFTELRIPSYCKDSLKHVINVLSKYSENYEIINELKNIHNKINLYKINKNEYNYHLLHETYQNMDKIYKSDHYLKVDLARENNYLTLPLDIKHKLENFVNLFSNLYIEQKNYSKLNSFKKKFLEKYGPNINVPLLEIIDENKFDGLKYLDKKFVPKSDSESNREKTIRQIIENKIQAALINGEGTVDFTIKDFCKVLDNSKTTNLVSSFDLNIITTKTKDNDLHFTIGPNQGSSLKFGNSFQRFSNIFDKQLFQKYNKMYQLEKQNNENKYLFVEGVELEKNARANNITKDHRNYH